MLDCMNCKKPVGQADGKLFAQVFVCPECYAVAENYYVRLEKELKTLLLISKDAIRVSLIEGKFGLSEQLVDSFSKKELLEEIVKLHSAKEAHDKKEECKTNAPPDHGNLSGENMPQHVRTLAALGNGSSNKLNPQD